MTNSKSHGQHGKTKGQSHTKETDSHVRKRGSKNGAPASPETNQKVPMNSATSFFVINSSSSFRWLSYAQHMKESAPHETIHHPGSGKSSNKGVEDIALHRKLLELLKHMARLGLS